VIPESVIRPRCPVRAGPSWVPRSSDHAAWACRGRGGQRDGPDLVSLAVQADLSGPSGEDDVLDIETAALWHPGPGVQHHRHDRPVPGAAAGSGPLDLALVGRGCPSYPLCSVPASRCPKTVIR